MKEVVLIDNDALVKFTKIKEIFNLMRNIYWRLEIPMEVKNEYERHAIYEPERIPILSQLRPNTGFWSLCTQLDSFSQATLYKHEGIDKGEAELLSQGEKKNIRIIISDDKKFKETADSLYKNFLIVKPLFVIASLDINGFLPNKDLILKKFHSHYRFKSKDLREAYQMALKDYSLNWTKKKISERTSLKKLGIT